MTKSRPNPLNVDPTRTGLYQRALQREIVRRMRELQREITKLVVTEDVFGLKKPSMVFNYNPNQPRDERGRWTSRWSIGATAGEHSPESAASLVRILERETGRKFKVHVSQ